ncbi:vacuole protein, variant 3 [Coprinopsis cinerea AmutBmut pab1-1]|nr:vacuole protein, variant 3 [Coprinopsis cinerea AmutBmut pab1-1]
MSEFFYGAQVDGSVQATLQSFAMIIASEIGDKTFLIAAILAMRHPRMVVFAGAFGSLVVMSVLSAAMGHLLPTLIPKRWTQIAASILFLVFGVKMFLEARAMKSGNEKIQEEMKEAEEEIDDDEAEREGKSIPLEEMEEGGREEQPKSPVIRKVTSWKDGARNFCSLMLGPVFVQAFVLTFLGEWGDRSQIATIALGAAHVGPTCPVQIAHRLTVFTERLSRDAGYRRWACLLHSVGGHWRPLCINKDFRKARHPRRLSPIYHLRHRLPL